MYREECPFYDITNLEKIKKLIAVTTCHSHNIVWYIILYKKINWIRVFFLNESSENQTSKLQKQNKNNFI